MAFLLKRLELTLKIELLAAERAILTKVLTLLVPTRVSSETLLRDTSPCRAGADPTIN
jgi:hypothetical protein